MVDQSQLKQTEFVRDLMRSLGLTEKEIDLHFKSFGLGPVTIGELALFINISEVECTEIIKKLVKVGLFKPIIGPRDYYQALPPYIVILRQMELFGVYLGELKEEISKELYASFDKLQQEAKSVKELDAFATHLTEVKQEMAGKLKDRHQVLSDLKNESNRLFETQFDALNTQVYHSLNNFDIHFFQVSSDLDKSFDSVKKPIQEIIGRLDSIPAKVASEKRVFQTKKSIEESVQSIIGPEIASIKEIFQTQILESYKTLVDHLKDTFQKELSVPLKEILEKSRDSFKKDFEIPFHALIDNVATKFTATLTEFDSILTDVQGKISNLSSGVMRAFMFLRKTFSEKVIDSIKDLIEKIKGKLNANTTSVQEFLEDASRVISQTIKDVFFIRTPEGIRSQIKESVAKAKMRILILAPDLTDIEFEPILALPQHINIRIACQVDEKNACQKEIISKIIKNTNISIRYREMQNLWGINRDTEEVIIGIVSKHPGAKEKELEVAGIGSVSTEHIKMLVPILEEAWMGSKKTVQMDIESVKVAEPACEIPIKTEEPIPSSETPTPESPPPGTATGNIIKVTEIHIDPNTLFSNPDDIIREFDRIAKNLILEPSIKSAEDLLRIRESVFKRSGYTRILNEMDNWINRLKLANKIDGLIEKGLTKQLSVWKQKIA